MASSVRETSRESYDSLNPSLSDRQERVYESLKELGSATDRELYRHMEKEFEDITELSQVRPRRTELKNMGAVEEKEKRTCEVSGETAFAWRVVLYG